MSDIEFLHAPEEAFSIDQILATSEILTRPTRKSDVELEKRVLTDLASDLIENPEQALQSIARAAQVLCGAESAGISIAEREDEKNIFRWRATEGKMKAFLNGTMPRDFSPCGHVAKTRSHHLMKGPILHYGYISQLQLPIHEVLLYPYTENDTVIGTVWVIAHTAEKKFDREDLRVLKSIAELSNAAIKVAASIYNPQRY